MLTAALKWPLPLEMRAPWSGLKQCPGRFSRVCRTRGSTANRQTDRRTTLRRGALTSWRWSLAEAVPSLPALGPGVLPAERGPR